MKMEAVGLAIVEQVSGLTQKIFVHVIYGFLASVGFFVSKWETTDQLIYKFWKQDYRVDVFDFIIVGAGSAGCVMANRLSENPSWKILLIEAGGEPNPLHSIPAFSAYMLNYRETDWKHLTVPQKWSCFGLYNQQSGYSQGRSLGGTSNINWLVHLRGSPHDFNNWANITADWSWSYEALLYYFKKSETLQSSWFKGFDLTHGDRGPMSVEIPPSHRLAQEFVDAGHEMGYNRQDLNGFYTQGFDYIHYGSERGKRDAVFRSYLQPARKRPNLTIYKYSIVNRILFHSEHNEAYGVEFETHGRWGVAYATKEVILTAGALQSPKLLMLSGIGPREHLSSVGIPCRLNLPVGDNLQDHVSTYLGPFVIDARKSVILDRDVTPYSLLDYLVNGQGVLSSSGISATGLISSGWAKRRGQTNWPDIQIMLANFGIHKHFARDLSRAFLIEEELARRYYQSSIGKDAFTLLVSVGRPESRGFLRLASSHPRHNLVIDPRFYENGVDMSRMIEAIKFAVNLAENTTPFLNLRSKLTRNPLPGCEHVEYRSSEYWECYARHISISLHHIGGTCAMGQKKSPKAVVDPQLRVIGTTGLRIADCSVIPVLPVSNTQAVCIVIAEKAADLIKDKWTLNPTLQSQDADQYFDFLDEELYKPTSKGKKMRGKFTFPLTLNLDPIPKPRSVSLSTMDYQNRNLNLTSWRRFRG